MSSETGQHVPQPPGEGDNDAVQRGRPGRHGARTYADLSQGSIPRHVFRLAWPQVTEQTLNIMDQLVDTFWAGRLTGGFRALAALGAAQTFSRLAFDSRRGMEQGTRAMISRAVGAGDLALANRIALSAFVISGVYSLIMVLVGLFLTDIALSAVGASQTVHEQAAWYMRLSFIGMTSTSFRMTAVSALQASGDVISPLRATTVTRVLHIVLSPFFMFGWWIFPEQGLAGAAFANLLAQTVGAAINLYALFYGNSRLRLTLHGFRIDGGIIWRLIKIGAPSSASGMERAVAQLFLLKIVSPFGDVAMASYGIMRRMDMFVGYGGEGVGMATGIMVGQNLGAKNPERAKSSILWGVVFVTAFRLLTAIPLIFFPALVVVVFTKEPEVVSLTANWLQLVALAGLFMGGSNVLTQAFNVAGDTLTVMFVTLLTVVIEIPLAWLLCHPLGIGPLGIAWATVIGMAIRTAIMVPLYFRGSWLKRKVI